MLRTCCLLFGVGLATPAVAQDAHAFFPAPFDGDIRDPLTFHRPGAMFPGEVSIGAMVDYARQPLIMRVESGAGTDPTRIPIIDHLLALDVSFSVSAHENLRFAVAAPFYGFSVDEDGDLLGPTIGDTRLSVIGLFVRPKHITNGGGFGLGLEGHVDFPTGNADRFLGRGGFGGGGNIIATYELPWFTLSGAVGAQYIPPSDVAPDFPDLAFNSAIDFGFTVSQASGFHIEARQGSPFQAAEHKGVGAPAEVLVSYRYRAHSGLFMAVGLAGGLTEGFGAAKYRAFLGLGWGSMPDRRPPDADQFAQFDKTDACPGEAEVYNNFQDDDGCPDTLSSLAVRVLRSDGKPIPDATVTLAGESLEGTAFSSVREGSVFGDLMPDTMVSGDAALGACLKGSGSVQLLPGDNQLDITLQPARPAEVEVRVWTPDGAPIPTANVFWRVDDRSCAPPSALPVDTEGSVKMQMGVGPATLLVTAPEYEDFEKDYTFGEQDKRVLNVTLQPKKKKVMRVRLEKKRIVILEKVLFEFGKAIIEPESFPLLNDVADTIVTNPQIGRVQVEGHTDSKGSDDFNQRLSQDRADAVREYLVGRGVDPERLVAVGFGETRPIADNETDEGREQNRRVEFNLIDQSDEPEFEEIEVQVDEQGNPILPDDSTPPDGGTP